MPISFGHNSKLYLLVCQNCALRVHRIVFMGSIFFEKNTFQIFFHFLGGSFSDFRQIFSSTVLRTALVSRFCYRIYANFFRTSRKILLRGLSDLHSTCPQDCNYEKHLLWRKHFYKFISDYRRKLFRFLAILFQHGSQNCIWF